MVAADRDDISNASYDKRTRVTANGHQIVRLEFTSAFEMLDFVQVVSDHVSRTIGMDEDASHWISVAIRESVINAIKHGNRNDASKRVFVEFETAAAAVPELRIRVRDQGEGFDPEMIADPLAPENLLKSSGRGIFLIRNFMDDVQLQRAPEGGMEIRMLKRVQPSGV
jgi:serine/threonine-protein kinase RsbW